MRPLRRRCPARWMTGTSGAATAQPLTRMLQQRSRHLLQTRRSGQFRPGRRRRIRGHRIQRLVHNQTDRSKSIRRQPRQQPARVDGAHWCSSATIRRRCGCRSSNRSSPSPKPSSAGAGTVDAGDAVTYTATITNDAQAPTNSTATAFDMDFSDTARCHVLELVPGFVAVGSTSGGAGGVNDFPPAIPST